MVKKFAMKWKLKYNLNPFLLKILTIKIERNIKKQEEAATYKLGCSKKKKASIIL